MDRRLSAGRLVWAGFRLLALYPLASLLAAAEPDRPARPGELPFNSLRLSFRTDQQTYVLGVPIAAYAELTNPHRQPIWAHRGYGWCSRGGTRLSWLGYLSVGLRRDGEEFDYRPHGMPLINIPPPEGVWMEPAATLRAKTLLVAEGSSEGLLGSPGTLEVAAGFGTAVGPPSMVRSRRVGLTLVRPSGTDAEAFAWLRDRRLLRYLGYIYFIRDVKDEEVEGFSTFAEKYPQSVYAPYAAFALGQVYFYRQRYPEAIHTFKDLAERHPKASVAEDALYLAAESYRKMSKPVEADQSLRELLKRYPETPAADDAKAMLAEIARYAQMLFHDDRRLDAKITFEVPTATLAADAFKVVSRLSGVPLRVSPGVWDVRCYGGQRTQTVRAFMAEFDRGPLRWTREPDGGYRLVPAASPP